ncbi:MAG: transposase [Propioniciclava sp.]
MGAFRRRAPPLRRIWCQIVALASELQAWSGMLALAGHEARRWEPKRLRYRLYTIPATLARRARRVILHLTEQSPWSGLIINGLQRLRGLPAPAT